MAKSAQSTGKRKEDLLLPCETLNAACFVKEGPQKRFIEPRLLFLIRRNPSYGYQLLSEIDKLPFPGPAPDSAAVYRMLRDLEKRGLVRSGWQPGEGGPAKRTYSITAAGRKRLGIWVEAFKERVSLLKRFIEMCEGEVTGVDDSDSN